MERQIVNGEERFLHLGETLAKRVLFVVVTERNDLLRVVTALPADRKANGSTYSRRMHTLPKALTAPEFKNDAEEALWWESSQSVLLNEFEQAAKE